VAALEAAKTEPDLVLGLDNLTKFVLEQKGLPQGIKKQQLITDIRKVKRAGKDGGYWKKDAEISYEQLIYSINYQQVREVEVLGGDVGSGWVIVCVCIHHCSLVSHTSILTTRMPPPPKHTHTSRPTRRGTWPTRSERGID
jgi:hypothetical protein